MSTVTVPDTARRVEGGDDFRELARLHNKHDPRAGFILASFSRGSTRYHARVILHVFRRALVLLAEDEVSTERVGFDDPGPVPPVWVWTADDEADT